MKSPARKATQQPAYLRAVPSDMPDDHRNILQRPKWTPPAWTPARPEADDHKQFKSFGTPA